jgi:XTP/dITP diphosphohydrolase
LTRPPVLAATRNPHKLHEIRDLLRDVRVSVLGLEDLGIPADPEEEELEPFDTFARNALSKARYFHGRSGIPTLADDSGLCVDALDGEPGVCTRRFAPSDWADRWGRDEANNRWLIARLERVEDERRGARYHCAIAVADDLEHAVFEGRVEGSIVRAPRGRGGFGYDPLFVPAGEGMTFAELPGGVKRALSHRAVALTRAGGWLRDHVESPRPTAHRVEGPRPAP